MLDRLLVDIDSLNSDDNLEYDSDFLNQINGIEANYLMVDKALSYAMTYKDSKLNARQTKVLNKILDIGVDNFKGDLSKKNYMIIADATPSTASRDINELLDLECIKQIDGTQGRNIRYKVKV